MKCVLASIRPKWCKKVESREKKAEVRKTAPLLPTPFKVYIYCTQGTGANTFNCPVSFETIRDDYIETGSMECINSEIGNGKVVGEFICTRCGVFPVQSASMKELSELSCVPVPELYKYAGGNTDLYGWHISDPVFYEKPKELSEFYKPGTLSSADFEYQLYDGSGDPKRRSYASYLFTQAIRRPPQSWCYVEELNV